MRVERAERVRQPAPIIPKATSLEGSFFTIIDLAKMLNEPLMIVKIKAMSVLRGNPKDTTNPRHIEIAFRQRVHPKGRPSLFFDRENLAKLAAAMTNLRPRRGRLTDASNQFPNAESIIETLAPLLGLDANCLSKTLPLGPRNQNPHPYEVGETPTGAKMAQEPKDQEQAISKKAILEAQQQTAVNLTLEILRHLTEGTLNQLPRNPLGLLVISLPDGFPLNRVIYSSDKDPKRAEKARVYCLGFFSDALKPAWEKMQKQKPIGFPNSQINPKEAQMLGYLRKLEEKGWDVKKIVIEACNYFTLPNPF